MSSIYFVRPNEEDVEQIIKDFTPPAQRLVSHRKGPAYKEAHIFFTEAVPSAIFDRLAGSVAAPHIKSFVETYLNFIPMESRVYHLGADASVFGKLFRIQPAAIGENPASKELQRMATQIVAAAVTMNEMPTLRYQKNSVNGHALKLAAMIQEEFDTYAKRNPNFKPLRDGQLLIMDRTVDLLAPVIHEFTLQAMANDLLKIEDGSKYSYSYSSGQSSNNRDVTLDENDWMWTSIRHKHIAEVSQVIVNKFNEFLKDNKAAGSKGGSAKDLKELKELMSSMAEFQETKSLFSLHLTLAQESLNQSDKRKLIALAKMEQDLATGVTADGGETSDVWPDLVQLIDGPYSSADKARLVLIFLLTQPNINDSVRKALFDHAKLGSDELESVKQLSLLAQGKSYTQRKPTVQGKRGARKTLLDEDFPYDVSRYVPAAKIILDDAANNELDEQEFPFLKGAAAATPKATLAAAAPISLRAKTSSSGTASSSASRGSIAAFIIGGTAYSETRSVYELTIRNGRDFYIGGDRVLTPDSFLQGLRESR